MDRIASVLVISDLHCHRFDSPDEESFFKAGDVRIPAANHPMESLRKLVAKGEVAADALLMPGDFCDQICRIGFIHAWDSLKELARDLNSCPMVAAIGNHDVDSRNMHHLGNSFEVAKTISGDFPFRTPEQKRAYFSDGFCRVPIGANLEVIALNTVIDHVDEPTAKRGTFSPKCIEAIAEELGSTPQTSARIALLHHHPLLHDAPGYTDQDVLASGNRLLEVLAQVGVSLVVHGHKHHPRLRYVDPGRQLLPVLAAGSFSAFLKKRSSVTRNVFHSIELFTNGPSQPFRLSGTIKTWEWNHGTGWARATQQSANFPWRTGFGAMKSIDELAASLVAIVQQSAGQIAWSAQELQEKLPALEFLTPSEQIALVQDLGAIGLELRHFPEGFNLKQVKPGS